MPDITLPPLDDIKILPPEKGVLPSLDDIKILPSDFTGGLTEEELSLPFGGLPTESLQSRMASRADSPAATMRQSLRLKQPLPSSPRKFTQEEEAAIRKALRLRGIGGVDRSADEWMREKVAPIQEGLASLGAAGGAIEGMKYGSRLGPYGAALGGVAGGALGYAITKPVVGAGLATPGELLREAQYGMVPAALKTGRGILPTALKGAAQIVAINESAQQIQSLIDEGEALSMQPGDVVKRNLIAGGFGGLLGAVAGRKIPTGKLAEGTDDFSKALYVL